MYLRPGNLIKSFTIEPVTRKQNSRGRGVTTYDTETAAVLRGVIASADPTAIKRFDQGEHPITHQIVQYSGPKAKPGDRLVRGHSHYYIRGVDNIAELGIATLYYVEERTDLDDGSEFSAGT